MQLTLRTKALLLAAAGVVAFIVFSPPPGDTVVAANDHHSLDHGLAVTARRSVAGDALARGSLAAPSTSAMERLAHRVADAAEASTLFAAHSWYVAPPPPPAPPAPPPTAAMLAPPAPTAPPLPFAFLGRYVGDGGAAIFYVTRADRVYDLKSGDIVDATYRFEGEQGGQLVFTYQPLNVQQMLPTDAK